MGQILLSMSQNWSFNWLIFSRDTGQCQRRKFPVTAGELICHQIICQAPEQCTYPPKNGQQHSNGIREQNGGHTISKLVTPSLPNVSVIPTTRNSSFSRAPPRQPEHHSRPGILAERDISKVDAQQRGKSRCYGCMTCLQLLASGIHQLEARYLCTGNRCPLDGVEVNRQLCIPSVLLDREVHTEGLSQTQYHHNSSALVALPGMVLSPDEITGGVPSATTQPQRPA